MYFPGNEFTNSRKLSISALLASRSISIADFPEYLPSFILPVTDSGSSFMSFKKSYDKAKSRNINENIESSLSLLSW